MKYINLENGDMVEAEQYFDEYDADRLGITLDHGKAIFVNRWGAKIQVNPAESVPELTPGYDFIVTFDDGHTGVVRKQYFLDNYTPYYSNLYGSESIPYLMDN